MPQKRYRILLFIKQAKLGKPLFRAHLNLTNENSPLISAVKYQPLLKYQQLLKCQQLLHAGVFCPVGGHLPEELPALPGADLAVPSQAAEEEHCRDLPHPHHHVLPQGAAGVQVGQPPCQYVLVPAAGGG